MKLPKTLRGASVTIVAAMLNDDGPTTTPRQLAAELDVSEKTIRQWLRDQPWQHEHYARWQLTAPQADEVRAHFSRSE